MNKLSTYFSLLVFLGLPSLILAQSPACPAVNAGADQTICPGQCVNLTATPVSGSLTTSYTVSSINYAPFNFNQGTPVTIGQDDVWSPVVNLPFCFQFYGVTYNQCVLGSNGLISFTTSRAGTMNTWPINAGIATNTEMTNSISCPYHDIDPSISGDIQYFLGGTAPCRYLVVSFAPIPMFSCTSLIATQQIVLYETTNVIDTYIQNKPLCTGWNAGAAIHGIKGANGNFTLVPGRDFPTQWTATNDARRFTPSGAPSYTIAWFQGATQIGTGATIQVCPNTTTTYTARVTYTNCAGNLVVSDDVVVSTNAPSPVTITSTQVNAGCGTNNGTATATPSGGSGTYTYNWNTTPAQTTQTATGLAPGTYAVTVTASGSAGCPATATFTITQPTASPVAVSGNNSICQGGIATFTATPGLASYNWTTPSGGTASGQLINATIAGVYTVTATNAQGCTATGSRTLTILPSPTVTVSNTGPYCDGAAISMTATPAGANAYSWAGPNGFTGNTATISSLVASATTAGVYNVTVTGSNTCTASGTTTVVSNPIPVPTVSSNSPVCTNTAITLTAGGGNTYAWSGPNGFSSSGSPLSLPGASASMAGTYTVTVTSGGNCSATASTNVVVNPLPTPTASNTGPYCPTTTIQLNATGGTSYSWSGPNAYTATGAAPTISNATAAMDGTYTVTATDANGCTNTATTVVTILPIPAAAATNTGPYCYGLSMLLTATPAGATSYAWDGPNGFTGSGQNINVLVASATTAGTYNVTVTGTNGCTATASTTVVTNPLPVPVVTSNSPICQGTTLSLSASGGNSYAWSGPNGYSSTSATPTITNATPAMSGNYNVTVTGAGGCTATAVVSVVINASPTPVVGNTGPYCPDATIQLNASGGIDYAWTGPNGFSATGANPTIPNATTTMSGTYNVTVQDANGCTATGNTPVLVNPSPIIAPTSNSPICVGTTLNLNAGTAQAGTTYAWTYGATPLGVGNTFSIANVTSANAGVYTVGAQSAAGCTATATTSVVINPLATPTITGNTVICPNQSTTLNAGVYNAYAWSTGPTTQTISPNQIGTYSVTVTDANTCTGSASITLTANPGFTVSAGNNGPYCTGETIDLNTNAGYVSYSWSGPLSFTANTVTTTRPNATSAMSGAYTVTVTDTDGCTATATTNVTVQAQLVPTITGVPANGEICAGTTGTMDAGAGYASYIWSNSSTAQTLTVGTGGIYTATVTDLNGCTGSASFTITVNQNPIADAGVNTLICNGTSTTLAASASGGESPYTYLWDNGLGTITNPSVTPATTTSYNVTVTDNNGCTGTDVVTIDVNPALTVDAGLGQNICAGTSATLTANAAGGAPAYNYTWTGSTISSNPSIVVSPAATTTYNVTLTDSHNCTATDNVTVTVIANPAPIVTTTSGSTNFCYTTDITLDAGSGYAAYQWQNGNTTQTRTVYNTGSYIVTVTDSNGCSGTGSITVNELQPVIISGTVTDVYCFGGSDGAVDITNTTGGVGSPYTYVWNTVPPRTTADITGIAAGNYTVTATDAFGCTGTTSYTIGQPATAVQVSIISSNATCFGASNGTAIANPYGGTANYTYNWSNNLGTSASVTTLAPNQVYTVTVTDARGCTVSGSVSVNQPSQIVLTPTAIVPTSCFNSTDGEATVVASGGTPGYAYQWSNGETGSHATQLPGGVVQVTVSDNYGCTLVQSLTVPQPIAVSININNQTIPSCNGFGDGSITVAGNSSAPPFAYNWSVAAGSQLTATATGLSAGVYSVTVTDINGCTAARNITLGEPSPIQANLTIVNPVVCNGDATGEIVAAANGGTPAYSFLWSGGETTAVVDSLPAGTYTVTVTDSRGCTITDNITLDQPDPLTATFTTVDALCFGANNGAISINATGGVLAYQYSIDNGASFHNGSNFAGLGADTYQIVIRDHNGCEIIDSVTVLEPADFITSLFPIDSTIEYGDVITLNTTASTPATYIWTPADSLSCNDCANPDAAPLTTTNYTVYISDANGCTDTLVSHINVIFNRRVYVPNLFTPNGDGNNDLFYVQGGRGLKEIQEFRVFDRWGELVYQQERVLPNTPGWDGQFKGKDVNSGVFVWYAKILYDDGLVELIKGDVTVLR